MYEDYTNFQFSIDSVLIDIDLNIGTPIEIGNDVLKLIYEFEDLESINVKDSEKIRELTSTYVKTFGMDAWNGYIKKHYIKRK